MMPWWLALLGVAMTFMALPMPLRAGGTPECPQAITCVAGNPFTELGDANCDRVLELADLTLLVRAPFCDACKTCMSKDANADARVSVADVTALIKILAQRLPTSTPTPTLPPMPTTSTPTAAPVTVTPTATATVTGATTATQTATAAPTSTPTEYIATDYSFAYAFGAPGGLWGTGASGGRSDFPDTTTGVIPGGIPRALMSGKQSPQSRYVPRDPDVGGIVGGISTLLDERGELWCPKCDAPHRTVKAT